MRYCSLIWILFMLTGACREEVELYDERLIGCWTHAFEEDSPDSAVRIYRPCDFQDFPVSRYRHIMELKENGACAWLQLAANDTHYMVQASWQYDDANRFLKIFDLSGKMVRQYEVIEAGHQMLQLKDH